MAKSDEPLGDEDAADEEFNRLQMLLLERIEEFIEDEDVGDADVADLLMSCAVHLRMVSYGMNVEKPSAGGLKLDLDRFRQDIEALIRDAKKGADDFILQAKEVRAKAGGEEEEE